MKSWKDDLKGDPLPWLLEASSPEVRHLALRDLLDRPADDEELREARILAHQTGPIGTVLNEMDEQGFWVEPGAGYNPKYRSTVWAVILLAQLGARIEEDERIGRACAYVLEYTLTPGGQFSTSGAPSGTVDCLQGNLCWALAALGCTDARLEKAFEWLARSVTGEGIAPSEDKKAPVRYYAAKCGPTFACGANYGQSCAWGAVKVLLALSQWPAARRTSMMERALVCGVDFLFSVDPATADYPTGGTGKPSRSWWKFGFPVFYVTDVLQNVEVLTSLGYGRDPRLANALALIRDKQDDRGRWALEYDYAGKTWGDYGEKKQPNKWVTLRALRALKAA